MRKLMMKFMAICVHRVRLAILTLPTLPVMLALLVMPLSHGCHRSRQDALLTLLEERGPSYYFTDPHRSSRDPFSVRKMIVHEIDVANESLDFWFYELDDPEIAAAVGRARDRGLRLHLVGSGDQTYPELEAVGIRPTIRPRSGLQHAKLLLLDRHILVSGTGNFTRSCMFYNNNVFFRSILDRDAADRMLSAMTDESTHHAPVAWRDGAASFRMMPSPSSGDVIQSALTQAVLDAHTRIRFMIFSFTDAALGGAMIRRARDGLPIEGVFEAYGSGVPEKDSLLYNMSLLAGGSPFFLYADGNERIFFDDSGTAHGGKLHHKTMIIDDRLVLTGSYNWSTNARDANLEAFFAIEDPAAPPIFGQHFEEIRRESQAVPRPGSDPTPGATLQGSSPCGADTSSLPTDAPFQQGILHTGHGAFFRGLVVRGPHCKKAEATSAGFERSGSFALPVSNGPLLTDLHPGRFEKRGDFWLPPPFACSAFDCDPCAAGSCEPVRLKRISLEAGWGLLQRPARAGRSEEIWIWHQGGIERRHVQWADEEFFAFGPLSPAPSGAVLFFPSEEPGEPRPGLAIACAFGAVPPGAAVFLDSLPWFYPRTFPLHLSCTAPD